MRIRSYGKLSLALAALAAICFWRAQVSFAFYDDLHSGNVDVLAAILQTLPATPSEPGFSPGPVFPLTERNIRDLFE